MVGLLYSATCVVNQNGTLYNLGSGIWLARANGAAAQCSHPLRALTDNWTRGCS